MWLRGCCSPHRTLCNNSSSGSALKPLLIQDATNVVSSWYRSAPVPKSHDFQSHFNNKDPKGDELRVDPL